MWVTKLLISPVKIRIFCPKKSKFGPKMAFLFFLGQALPAHLVGGCGVRAVSRKTPIYFIIVGLCHVTCQSRSRLEIGPPNLLLPSHGQLEADPLDYPKFGHSRPVFLPLSL